MDKIEKGTLKMEEYIEDILEDNDSREDLLDALDFDSDLFDGQWLDMKQDDDSLYCQ